MTDLMLNSNGDLSIVDGDLVLIPTVQQLVRQQVEITLRTFRGEWAYNTEFGVPYVENEENRIEILGKTPKAIFDIYMREGILSVEGVTSIDEYSSSRDFPSQVMTVQFRASTSSGPITESIAVEI